MTPMSLSRPTNEVSRARRFPRAGAASFLEPGPMSPAGAASSPRLVGRRSGLPRSPAGPGSSPLRGGRCSGLPVAASGSDSPLRGSGSGPSPVRARPIRRRSAARDARAPRPSPVQARPTLRRSAAAGSRAPGPSPLQARPILRRSAADAARGPGRRRGGSGARVSPGSGVPRGGRGVPGPGSCPGAWTGCGGSIRTPRAPPPGGPSRAARAGAGPGATRRSGGPRRARPVRGAPLPHGPGPAPPRGGPGGRPGGGPPSGPPRAVRSGRSARAGPCHSASASSRRAAAFTASPSSSARVPSPASRWNRCRSTSSLSTHSR